MQFTKIVVAISSILAVASATPAPAVKQLGKRSYNNVQQECGNNFKPQCCNNVQFTSFGFFQLPVGAACNDINTASKNVGDECSLRVACCQTGPQTGLVNIGSFCPMIFL